MSVLYMKHIKHLYQVIYKSYIYISSLDKIEDVRNTYILHIIYFWSYCRSPILSSEVIYLLGFWTPNIQPVYIFLHTKFVYWVILILLIKVDISRKLVASESFV